MVKLSVFDGTAFYRLVSLIAAVVGVCAIFAFGLDIRPLSLLGRLMAVVGIFRALTVLWPRDRELSNATLKYRWAGAAELSSVSLILAALRFGGPEGVGLGDGAMLVVCGASQLSLIIWVTYTRGVLRSDVLREEAADNSRSADAAPLLPTSSTPSAPLGDVAS